MLYVLLKYSQKMQKRHYFHQDRKKQKKGKWPNHFSSKKAKWQPMLKLSLILTDVNIPHDIETQSVFESTSISTHHFTKTSLARKMVVKKVEKF